MIRIIPAPQRASFAERYLYLGSAVHFSAEGRALEWKRGLDAIVEGLRAQAISVPAEPELLAAHCDNRPIVIVADDPKGNPLLEQALEGAGLSAKRNRVRFQGQGNRESSGLAAGAPLVGRVWWWKAYRTRGLRS